MRDIVHRWCVVERRAPGSQEDLQEQALIDLQKETLTKLESGVNSIVDRIGLLVDATSRFGELLNFNEAELTRLMNTSNGHYNISAQAFATLWSVLELIQRFYVERLVDAGRTHCPDRDVHRKVVNTTDSIRMEGLRMIVRLLEDCGSTQPIQPYLISPSSDGMPNSLPDKGR